MGGRGARGVRPRFWAGSRRRWPPGWLNSKLSVNDSAPGLLCGEDGIGDTDEADGTGEDTGLSDEDLYQDPDFGDNDSEAPLGQIR